MPVIIDITALFPSLFGCYNTLCKLLFLYNTLSIFDISTS
jgi:hypothetical protein